MRCWDCSGLLHSTPKESIHVEFRRVSTQNLGNVGPMTCLGNSSLAFHTKWNRVCEKIQSGSKVLKQSLKACDLSASDKEFCGKTRFFWTFRHDFSTNFSLEIWNHLQFFHKPRLNCCKTLIGCPSNYLQALLNLHFEYSLANKVYTFFWSRV